MWLPKIRLPGTPIYLALVVSLVVVCGSLIGLDGWHSLQARDTALADDESETANLARSLSQHIHDTVQSVDTIIIGLRERVVEDGLSAGRLARLNRVMAARVQALPALHGLFLYDTGGELIANSLGIAPAGTNYTDRAYFQYHRDTPSLEPHVGSPLRSRSDGRWIITVSRRVDDGNGAFAGVIVATLSLDYLNAYYARFDVGRTGVVSLLMADGTMAVRNPSNAEVIGKNFANQNEIFQRYLPRSPVGTFRYVSVFDGRERLGSFRRVDDYPLVVVVAHSVEDVLATWQRDALLHLAVSVSLCAALCAAAFPLARQIKRRQDAERLYRLLADNSSDVITCTGVDGQRHYVSPAFTVLTGWSGEECQRRHWSEYIHPSDHHILEEMKTRLCADGDKASAVYRYRCKDESYLWVEGKFHLVPGTDGKPAQFVANIRDISERKIAEDELEAAHRELANLATTDGLTGLKNRRAFDHAAAVEWDRAARAEQPLSVLMIDVDRFKAYNDCYGHVQGDACLRSVAAVIAGVARRPSDVVARYGGEEIVMLLPETDDDGAACVAEWVRAAVEGLLIMHIGNPSSHVVTVSVGVATCRPTPHGAGKTEDLVARADAALYEAKRRSRNCVVAAGKAMASRGELDCFHEQARLAVAAGYEQIYAGQRSDDLDRVARLAAAMFQAPIALIAIVGEERQSFAGRIGLDIENTSRETSFCAHTIMGDSVFNIPDATQDARFSANPLVTGDPAIRFYAGAPLLSPDGYAFGALCIIDRSPRPALGPAERALLMDLAALASRYMEQHRLDTMGVGQGAALRS